MQSNYSQGDYASSILSQAYLPSVILITGMGSPFVYVLLLLINEFKKICFGQWVSRIELGWKIELNLGRKNAESRRSHVALPE